MKFASGCLESSLPLWIKCAYRELGSVLGLLQKISCCTKSGHKQDLFQQHDFLFNVYKSMANTNSKEQVPLMDQDRGKP